MAASSQSPNAGTVTLLEAADQLGVHYMTAYRYVRTGQLDAHKHGSQWVVSQRDLDRFTRLPATPPRRRPRADHVGRLVTRLMASDEGGAWTVVQRALAGGVTPTDLYLGVLAPTMREIGDRWARGDVSVGQEHQASAVMVRLVGRLGPLFSRPGRDRGAVVLGAPPGDHHSLPGALFADVLRGHGLQVIQLGADAPASSFVEAAGATERLVAVGVTVTLGGNESAVGDVVAALHEAGVGPVVLGGQGVAGVGPGLDLDADRVVGPSDGVVGNGVADALAAFDQLADDAQRVRRRARRSGS
jgi:MerR family transcriptional regulator, light-induced transcriptional regulator